MPWLHICCFAALANSLVVASEADGFLRVRGVQAQQEEAKTGGADKNSRDNEYDLEENEEEMAEKAASHRMMPLGVKKGKEEEKNELDKEYDLELASNHDEDPGYEIVNHEIADYDAKLKQEELDEERQEDAIWESGAEEHALAEPQVHSKAKARAAGEEADNEYDLEDEDELPHVVPSHEELNDEDEENENDADGEEAAKQDEKLLNQELAREAKIEAGRNLAQSAAEHGLEELQIRSDIALQKKKAHAIGVGGEEDNEYDQEEDEELPQVIPSHEELDDEDEENENDADGEEAAEHGDQLLDQELARVAKITAGKKLAKFAVAHALEELQVRSNEIGVDEEGDNEYDQEEEEELPKVIPSDEEPAHEDDENENDADGEEAAKEDDQRLNQELAREAKLEAGKNLAQSAAEHGLEELQIRSNMALQKKKTHANGVGEEGDNEDDLEDEEGLPHVAPSQEELIDEDDQNENDADGEEVAKQDEQQLDQELSRVAKIEAGQNLAQSAAEHALEELQVRSAAPPQHKRATPMGKGVDCDGSPPEEVLKQEAKLEAASNNKLVHWELSNIVNDAPVAQGS